MGKRGRNESQGRRRGRKESSVDEKCLFSRAALGAVVLRVALGPRGSQSSIKMEEDFLSAILDIILYGTRHLR